MSEIDLIDIEHYSAQAEQIFPSGRDALQHYVLSGQAADLDPHPYFNTQWYRWQNPDAASFSSPLHHYFEISQRRIVDPSPMIDMAKFRTRCGVSDPAAVLGATVWPGWTGFDGVYRDYTDLIWHQQHFRDQIQLNIVRPMPGADSGARRRFLVWVQIGPKSVFANWFSPERERNWDLIANWYVPESVRSDLGEGIITQRGTKFTAIYNAWCQYPEYFNSYEAILLLDDDIYMDQEQIDQMFVMAKNNELDFFQPSLTVDSQGHWPIFFHNSKTKWRKTNGVEIMMPGFSRRAFRDIAPLHAYSVSGFGIDLLFAKVAEEKQYKCGVLDVIQAAHKKHIDQEHGAYYKFLRQYGVNSKSELWYLINTFKLKTEFIEM